ncbi:MAG TPA: histidine kinase dimerization/phospho-acceptor domain-containing protein [Acidimicrobiales bacterium]|nr:histidine kinase dimerization/phospho-acceptor domain-containing protein [Acidimicrobiales bacterium]
MAAIRGTPNFLVVGASLATVDRAIDGVQTLLFVGGPLAVFAAAVAGDVIAGAALRPVERMRRQASEASADDDDFALDVPRTDDEIAALAETLNDLLRRLHGALGRQRGFIASASHELRTPLTALTMELDLAARADRSPGELRAAVVAAREEALRLGHLCEDLLLLAQSESGVDLVRPLRQPVAPVLSASVEAMQRLAVERHLSHPRRRRGPHLRFRRGGAATGRHQPRRQRDALRPRGDHGARHGTPRRAGVAP